MIKSPWVWIHEKLTTGIHGAGANTILHTGDLEGTPTEDLATKAPTSEWAFDHNATFEDHNTRHKWLGADELAIKDSWLAINPAYYKAWNDINGFTASHTNSGSFAQQFRYGLLSTGATDNSRACIYSTTGFPVYATSANYRARFYIRINQSTAPTTGVLWVGLLNDPTAPTATQRHIAFKIDGVDVYASCGDGTNGNLEDTGINCAQYSTLDLYFKQIDDTDIEFYVDGVLKVTFTTYSPTSWQTAYITLYVLNTAAETSTFLVFPLKFLSGDD